MWSIDSDEIMEFIIVTWSKVSMGKIVICKYYINDEWNFDNNWEGGSIN